MSHTNYTPTLKNPILKNARLSPVEMQRRYLQQLEAMRETARRNEWTRVEIALSELIDRVMARGN